MSLDRRRAELVAKRAQLAELKQQRAARLASLSLSLPGAEEKTQPSPETPAEEDVKALVERLLGRKDNAPEENGARQVLSEASVVTHIDIAPLHVNTVREMYTKEVQTDAILEEEDEEDEEGNGAQMFPEGPADPLTRQWSEMHAEPKEPALDVAQKETREETAGNDQAPVDSELSIAEKEELLASNSFATFLAQGARVMERALQDDYDILMNYTTDLSCSMAAAAAAAAAAEKGGISEALQLHLGGVTTGRCVKGIDFCPAFSELVCVAYGPAPEQMYTAEGLLAVWNMHSVSRPEFVFDVDSPVTCAKFSPFSPNLIVAGTESGQVLVYDMRSSRNPIHQTNMVLGDHPFAICDLEVLGTAQSHNIVSIGVDGMMCVWEMSYLSTPLERTALLDPLGTKFDELAPTAIGFNRTDASTFLAGTEAGNICSVNRLDRPGAKAGTEDRISYRQHSAPVTSIALHPGRGPVDFSDLFLSSALDWTVCVWKQAAERAEPIFTFPCSDMVLDAAWCPNKPSVFACVTYAGSIEIWDMTVSVEDSVRRLTPSYAEVDSPHVLNRIVWDKHNRSLLAAGDINGTVFIYNALALADPSAVRPSDWESMQRIIAKKLAGIL